MLQFGKFLQPRSLTNIVLDYNVVARLHLNLHVLPNN